MVVALLVVGGFALFVATVKPKKGRRTILTLRVFAVSGVLLAYFQPSLRFEEVRRSHAPVIVIVDESASMQTRDQEFSSRLERVKKFFHENAAYFENLKQKHEVRYFACSDRVRPIQDITSESFTRPRGSSTDLTKCLAQAIAEVGQEPGGAILITDGVDTGRASQADQKSLKFSGPLWVLIVQEAPSKDIAVATISGLSFVLDRNICEVRVLLAYTEVAHEEATVALLLDGEVVDSKKVSLPGKAGFAEVTFYLLPKGPGRHVVKVVVHPLEGELNTWNNQYAAAVTVVRDRTRILHVAGFPSWDLRFLREALRSYARSELVSFHTLRDPFLQQSLSKDDETVLIPFPAHEIFQEKIESFDLVVLQDYDFSDPDGAENAESIRRYIVNGGSLLYVVGSIVPRGANLLERLGVREGISGKREMLTGAFRARIPNAARLHPLFGFGGRWMLEEIEAAPPLPAIKPLRGEGAWETLIEVADPNSPGVSWPLLMVAAMGKGVVAVLATDALWRWAFSPDYGPLYGQMVRRLIAFLTREPDAGLVKVSAGSERVAPGEKCEFVVSAAFNDGDILGRLESLSGQGVETIADLTGRIEKGKASLSVTLNETGEYRMTVVHLATGLSADDVVVVGPATEELFNLWTPGAIAKTLAASFGGELHPVESPALERFRPRGGELVRTGVRVILTLWDHPLVLAIVILVFALEWYLERRLGQT